MPTEPGLPPDQVDWDALARYFAGESSAEEAEATSRWLAEHPDEAEAFAALDSVTARLDALPADSSETEPDVEAAWQRVAAQLDEASAAPTRSATKVYSFAPRRPSVWRSPALRAAAAVAIIAGGAAVWQTRSNNGIVDTQTLVGVYRTAPGERDSVVLEDGTGVLLGPGSELFIEEGAYGNGRRDVTLRGEALFDVRHDDARPFVVHASDVMVHDLGTTFTVRTTNGTPGATTVAVTVGAVRMARTVTATDSGVVLRAGDRGIAVPGAVFTIERGAALDAELAFTRGQLVFRDTRVLDVAATLQRWYGVNVRVADSALSSRTLTASFNGEPLSDVLRVIGLALDAPVTQGDSTVVIGRRDPPRNPSR